MQYASQLPFKYDLFPNPRYTMIVCICRNISDREIARHAKAGLSFDDIQFETGLSSQCGRCEGCARDVVAQCSAMGQIAHLHKEGSEPHNATIHIQH